MPYYVYILLCEDGSYYTGHTKDLENRFERHKKNRGARYTKLVEPEKIVYTEEFETRSEAMKRERKIKSLSHSQKERLIDLRDRSKFK